MICKLKRSIVKECGYQLPDINEIYFLNIDDLNSISTTFIGDCEYINGIDYEDRFYKVEGYNISYTDALIVDDYQRYRQKTLDFNLLGKDDACRLQDYTMLVTGRYAALLKVEGSWIFAAFSNGFEADENEISTENDFHIVMSENSIVSSLPVDDEVAEAIIHNEPPVPQVPKARFVYTSGNPSIAYQSDSSDTTISASDYDNNRDVLSVEIYDVVTEIAANAFQNCSTLTGVTIPSSVTTIGSHAFSKTGLIGILRLPNGVSSIGDAAFDITNLSEIIIPSSVTVIGSNAFDNSLNLEKVVFLGQVAPMIQSNTFIFNYGTVFVPCDNESYTLGNWANIETVEMASLTFKVGSFSFELCGHETITYSVVDDFVADIGIRPEAITDIEIGEFVSEIGDAAFSELTGVSAITSMPTVPPVITDVEHVFDDATIADNIIVYVPSDSVNDYQTASGWRDNASQIHPIGWTPTPDYSQQYLTFVALEDGTFTFNKRGTGNDIQYSLDSGETWTSLASNTDTPTIRSGDTIMWKGELTPSSTSGSEGIGVFSSEIAFKAQGNTMSLIFGDSFVGQTSLSGKNYAFYELFSECNMLELENIILPATTLADYCYAYMFYGCASFNTAPELPARTLAQHCYEEMFHGCFFTYDATPELPATTLVDYCYKGMFSGCSLRTTPELHATTLANGCYEEMFKGSQLETAPELPATTLAYRCYASMFEECRELTRTPQLPATTLAMSCYIGMFRKCRELTTAPELPATTLADFCYWGMFEYCTSLTTAPVLPATTLVQNCYSNMFIGCWTLNYIKMLATDISATGCLTNWVGGVAATGTFVKAASQTGLTVGDSGIPSGWTVQDA